MLMPAIAAQIAEKLGLGAPSQDVEEDAEEFRPVPNRADLRRRGLRRSANRPARRRLRAAPHPLGQATLLKPAVHAKRLQQVEELKAAYGRSRDAGDSWVTPQEEQADRDRRAARRRHRAGRRASRPS